MTVLGRVCAAVSLLAASGCFEPVYEDCRVACTSDDDCAPGQGCGATGMCVGSAEPSACAAPAEPEPEPEPVPVSPVGTYNLTLTNQENGCDLPDWNLGSIIPNVGVKVTEKEAMVLGEAQGTIGSVYKSWLGTNMFSGSMQGARLLLVLHGTKFVAQRGCSYTFDATIDATLTGDTLDGSMFYRARTNGALACGDLNGCASRQALRGSRPPRPM